MKLTAKNKKNSSKKPAGQRLAASPNAGLRNALPVVATAEAARSTAKIAEDTVPFMVKSIFVVALLAGGIYLYKNRFVAWNRRSDLPQSNVSDAEAESRAAAIYDSVGYLYDSFDVVYQALSGLNYNGFVKVYNAFGKQSFTGFGDGYTMIEFIQKHYSDNEVQQLRMLLNGAFF